MRVDKHGITSASSQPFQNSPEILRVGIMLGIVSLLLIALNFAAQRATLLPGNWYTVGFAVIGIVGCAAILWHIRTPNTNPLEIIYPLTAFYLLNFPLRALFMAFGRGKADYIYGWPWHDDYLIALSLGYFLIGMAAFWIGYFWRGPTRLVQWLPTLKWQLSNDGLLTKTLILYGIGFLAFVYLFLNDMSLRFQWDTLRASSRIYGIALLLGGLRLPAIYLIWVLHLQHRRMYGLAFLVVAIEIAIGVLAGSKLDIFESGLAVLFAYQYTGRAIGKLAIIAALVFVFVAYPIVQTYREVYAATFGFDLTPNLVDLPSVVLASIAAVGSTDWFASVVTVMNRAVFMDSLAIIVHRVPDVIPYANGETIWPMLAAGFIPRVLWPAKPVLTLGGYMNSVLMGSPSTSNMPLTFWGELYLNYGIYGLIPGMLLLGVLFRWIYLSIHKIIQSPILCGLVYLPIFLDLLFSGSGIVNIPVGFIRTLLFQLVIAWALTHLHLPPRLSLHPSLRLPFRRA